MKKLLFISLAVILALSVGLVGCTGGASTYTLTIAVSGNGTTGPAAGTYTYDPGTVVNLTATADVDNYFQKWSGDVGTVADVTGNTTTITMNGNYDVTANFLGPWTTEIDLTFHCTANSQASIWTKVQLPWIFAVQNITGSHGGTIRFTNITFGESPYAPEDSLTALGADVVDVGQLSSDTFHLGTIGYVPGVFNMTQEAYALATVFATDEVNTWDVLGELDKVKVLLATPLWPNQWFGDFNLTQLSDLSGEKVRAEGGEVDTVEALDAIPVEIGTGDIANALTLHLIEGCFFTWSAATFGGIADASAYCTQLDFFPRPYFLAMNRAKYENLHPEARALLDALCEVSDSESYALSHFNGQGFLRGQCQSKVDNGIYIMPGAQRDEILAACSGIGPAWVAKMNGFGFDGDGFFDRVEDLVAAAPY